MTAPAPVTAKAVEHIANAAEHASRLIHHIIDAAGESGLDPDMCYALVWLAAQQLDLVKDIHDRVDTLACAEANAAREAGA